MNDELSAQDRAELARLTAPVTEESVAVVKNWDWQQAIGWSDELALEVDERRQEVAAENREYRETLGKLRRAAGLTQVAVAERMERSQSYVSQIEQGGDILLSTFLAYLHGNGVQRVTMAVTTDAGELVELDLEAVVESGEQRTS